jgi:hydroxyacylglutathione hydrolase
MTIGFMPLKLQTINKNRKMKLTNNIHLLQSDFEISISPEKKLPRFVNVIIIFSDKITLIDTGVKGSERDIFDYIKLQNRDYSEIDSIILSHSHPDHIGSAAQIKSLTNCKVYAHKLEKKWIENIELQNQERPVPGFYNLVEKSVTIDQFLDHEQEISLQDSLTLKIIKSPGHSKGSLNILFKEDRILFTADSIPLKNDIPNYDNYLNLLESLDTISQSHDYDIILTSWTPPISDASEIRRLIKEGKDYIQKINSIVKDCYITNHRNSLENCKMAIDKLGLPPFLANPITDKAFQSHLRKK